MSRGRRLLLYAPHFSEYSTRLAEALAEHADVLFILNGDDRRRQCEDAWFRAATAKMQVLEFTVHRRFHRAFWTPVVILRALLFRPEVVHIQEQADRTSAWLAAVSRRIASTVVTIHDPKPHSGRDSLVARDARRYHEMIRSAARLFHAHGEFCRNEVLALDPSRPVVQTHHGVIHVPDTDRQGAPEEGRILFFGRMEAYKGIEVLLDAVQALNEKGRDYTLVLAGRGSELDRLRSRAASTRGVELLDHFLSPAEVVEQFQKAAVVVLPYLDATQSGVAAGAIANGRPMVASSVGGLVDIVQDGRNGLLVPPGDVQALAKALDDVLQDEALRERLARGVRANQPEFAWAPIARTLAAAYEAMFDDRKP